MLVLYSWPREYLIYAYQAGFLTYSIFEHPSQSSVNSEQLTVNKNH